MAQDVKGEEAGGREKPKAESQASPRRAARSSQEGPCTAKPNRRPLSRTPSVQPERVDRPEAAVPQDPYQDSAEVRRLSTLLGAPGFRNSTNPLGWLAEKLGVDAGGVVDLLKTPAAQSAMAAMLAVDVFSLIQPVLQKLKTIALTGEPKEAIAAAKLLLQHVSTMVDPVKEISASSLRVQRDGVTMLAAELRRKKKTGGRRV